MAARKPLEAKFKPHVGRIFHLRKTRLISIYKQGKASATDGERVVEREEVLGRSVLVLDETNTRICVTAVDGTAIWIQKYYLHKEMLSDTSSIDDNISDVVVHLMHLSKNLRTDRVNSLEEQNALCKEIEKIAITLRATADKLKGNK